MLFPSPSEFDVIVSDPSGKFSGVKKKGRFDSNERMTSVPEDVIQSLNPYPSLANGNVFYIVDISLEGNKYELVKVISTRKKEVVIGLDILESLFRRANSSLETFKEIGRVLTSPSIPEIREILDLITEKILKIFDAQECLIFLIDEKRSNMITLQGKSKGLFEEMKFIPNEYNVGEGIVGLVVSDRIPKVIRDIDDYASRSLEDKDKGDYPEIWYKENGIMKRTSVKTLLAVPLIAEDKTIGVILLVNKLNEEGFGENDKFLLFEILSVLIAIVIRGAHLIREERLLAWKRVSAEASHEIGNKMYGLAEWIELLKDSLAELEPSRQYIDYINQMNGIIEDTKEILNEFESLSKPLILTIKEIDLNALLQKEYGGFGNGVKIRFDLNESLPLIKADSTRLKQIFLNLVKNSKEAMRNKGEIIIKTGFVQSSEGYNYSLTTKEDYIKIEFIDTGLGIPEEKKLRMFDPFFTTKEKGTGLGLAIVKRIIEAHKGFIDEIGEFGKGARFRILLPIRQSKGGINNG